MIRQPITQSPSTTAIITMYWCQPPRSLLPHPGFGSALMQSPIGRSTGMNSLNVELGTDSVVGGGALASAA